MRNVGNPSVYTATHPTIQQSTHKFSSVHFAMSIPFFFPDLISFPDMSKILGRKMLEQHQMQWKGNYVINKVQMLRKSWIPDRDYNS